MLLDFMPMPLVEALKLPSVPASSLTHIQVPKTPMMARSEAATRPQPSVLPMPGRGLSAVAPFWGAYWFCVTVWPWFYCWPGL